MTAMGDPDFLTHCALLHSSAKKATFSKSLGLAGLQVEEVPDARPHLPKEESEEKNIERRKDTVGMLKEIFGRKHK